MPVIAVVGYYVVTIVMVEMLRRWKDMLALALRVKAGDLAEEE